MLPYMLQTQSIIIVILQEDGNNDLLDNHLRDNPLCSRWHEIEDGEHYFFHCNNYRNERHQFFEIARDFQPRTINLLLYGNETPNNQLNIVLLRAVHEYIQSDIS